MKGLWLVLSLCLPAVGVSSEGGSQQRTLTLKQRFEPCIRKGEKGYEEPKTLPKLLDCQFGFRIKWVREYNREKGAAPPNKTLDTLDDLQRQEVREYLGRHPDRAHTDYESGEEAAKSGESPKTARNPGSSGNRRCKQDLAGLKKGLDKSSDEGKLGITQDGALQIVDFLECQQGSVSSDMQDLLNHVVRDGPKLQHDTMLRLKRAAREAKESGLDLGVDKSMEDWLLDPKEDPPDDPNGPNPTAGPNVN